MDKKEWELKLQKMGFDVTLDKNVLVLKTDNKEEAIKFKKAIKDYHCSWGVQVKRNEQDEFLQNNEEHRECIEA